MKNTRIPSPKPRPDDFDGEPYDSKSIETRKKLFVAIDSGGTRTNIRLVTEDGDGSLVSNLLESNSTLSGTLDIDDYPATLEEIMRQIDQYWDHNNLNHINTVTYCYIASAGYAINTQNAFRKVMKQILPNHLDGSIVRAGASNDTVSLIYAYNADVAIIAGTGSNIIVRRKDGSLYQSGGQDWVAYDNGAGFWIGLNAIRQVARDYHTGNYSTLLSRFRNTYEVSEGDTELISKFRELAVAGSDMKARIARFARDVCAAAQAGDTAAQDIVKTEAEDFANYVATAIKDNFDRTSITNGLTVATCGNVFHNKFYREKFEQELFMRLSANDGMQSRINWVGEEHGIECAYLLARRLEVSEIDYKRVEEQFQPVIIDFIKIR